MLVLTEAAAEVVKSVTSTPQTPDGMGLRIVSSAPEPEDPGALQLAAAAGPGENDQVIEAAGARVFLVLAATVFAHESAVFGVHVLAGAGVDVRLSCRVGSGCAEEAGERGDRFEEQGVSAGLLVGGVAGAELGDGAAVVGLGGELAEPGGDGGVLEGGRAAGAVRLVAGELGDCFLGAGIVDEVLAGGRGGDERGGCGVVEGAGQAVGDPVQPGDGVVGEQRVVPAG